MSIEITVPSAGESVSEVQIGRWLVEEGEQVRQDQDLVELETDKASLELPAPEDGVVTGILKQAGDLVSVGDVIAIIEPGKAAKDSDGEDAKASSSKKKKKQKAGGEKKSGKTASAVKEKDKGEADADSSANGERGGGDSLQDEDKQSHQEQTRSDLLATPSARRALREHGLTESDIVVEGFRIDREDVMRHLARQQEESASEAPSPAGRGAGPGQSATTDGPSEAELEESVPMSLIRRRIAERLVQAQQQAALLTTFNEIDMSAVMELRKTHQDQFIKKYDIKLGFMSFFVKAVIDALKQQPGLNAEIRDGKIVYRNYYHIGIAIGGERGLVVPVLRFAERLSFSEIELAIDDFAQRARKNKLKPDELAGGTFTITNGGIFGSLLSTPIVNPPQSGVLGMHAIQERPVAINGEVVIRPMMYTALTYDHRLVDGREAVTFLKRISDAIEDPARMMLEV